MHRLQNLGAVLHSMKVSDAPSCTYSSVFQGPPLSEHYHSFKAQLPQLALPTPRQVSSSAHMTSHSLVFPRFAKLSIGLHISQATPLHFLSRGEPPPQSSDSVFVKWTELPSWQRACPRALDPFHGSNFPWSSCLSLHHVLACPWLLLGQTQKEVT